MMLARFWHRAVETVILKFKCPKDRNRQASSPSRLHPSRKRRISGSRAGSSASTLRGKTAAWMVSLKT
eukprot:3118439-Heterocapsa_arctica.AAC.1